MSVRPSYNGLYFLVLDRLTADHVNPQLAETQARRITESVWSLLLFTDRDDVSRARSYVIDLICQELDLTKKDAAVS